jgi:hypothetical protein
MYSCGWWKHYGAFSVVHSAGLDQDNQREVPSDRSRMTLVSAVISREHGEMVS